MARPRGAWPLLLLLGLAPATALGADVPDLLSMQGYLKTSVGEPLSGTVSLVVRLYAQKTSPTPLYTETLSAVTVAGGRFKVLVGAINVLPSSVFSSNAGIYVGLSVDGGAELPRRQLSSSPYSLMTRRAATAAAADTATTATGLACSGCVDTTDVSSGAIGMSQLSSAVSDTFVDSAGDTVTGPIVFDAKPTFPAGLDAANQEIERFRFQNAATPPTACTSDTMGLVYFNTAEQKLQICNGTTWFGLATADAPDEDGDGVGNSEDNCLLIANADQADADSDGKGDVCDDDRDGDGAANGADNCPSLANADQTDTDSDGSGDACDTDDDGDGVLDGADNCPLVTNVGQADLDSDGQGDVCDSDIDGDGAANGSDNCPTDANASQLDTDADGLGDVCDTDDDGDGDADLADNCPLISNADQLDTDSDGLGDVCDPDDDGDGIADGSDNCPVISNASQSDLDSDGLGDACDPDDDGDGVADGSDNCPVISNASQTDSNSDGTGDACTPSYANATTVCPSPGVCSMGACDSGYGDCNSSDSDGCEIDTQSDSSHCGSCGNACTGGDTCQSGSCAAAGRPCAVHFRNYSNWMEIRVTNKSGGTMTNADLRFTPVGGWRGLQQCTSNWGDGWTGHTCPPNGEHKMTRGGSWGDDVTLPYANRALQVWTSNGWTVSNVRVNGQTCDVTLESSVATPGPPPP